MTLTKVISAKEVLIKSWFKSFRPAIHGLKALEIFKPGLNQNLPNLISVKKIILMVIFTSSLMLLGNCGGGGSSGGGAGSSTSSSSSGSTTPTSTTFSVEVTDIEIRRLDNDELVPNEGAAPTGATVTIE